MNNDRKLKVLVLSVGLVFGVMTPVIAQTQLGGGLFGYGRETEQRSREGLLYLIVDQGGYFVYNQQFGDDENGGFNLNNQTFGQEAPLGSGLLILTAAAAGYALRKRKNNRNNQKS